MEDVRAEVFLSSGDNVASELISTVSSSWWRNNSVMFHVIYHQWKWQAEDGMDMTSLNQSSWLLDLRTFMMKCNYWIYCSWELFDSGLSYKVVLGLSSDLILIMWCIFYQFICSLVLLVGGHLRRLHQGPAGQRQPLVLASVRLAHLQSLHLLMVCVNIMTFSLLVWLLFRFHGQ